MPENLSGPSALCMSCHDGTVALGSMLQPPNRGRGVDMRDQFVTGRSRFGTNLSNHHPVGFKYSLDNSSPRSGLAKSETLKLPLTDGQVHCTSCHDPHSYEHPPFLRQPSKEGVLCLKCHIFSGDDWDWTQSAHANSTASPRSGNPWKNRKPEWAGRNVAENACENCHATHHADSPDRLMTDQEENTCFRCHNGSVADFNIQTESLKFYRHPVELPSGRDHTAERIETSFSTPLHVECEDCHNPHAVRKDKPMISFNPANPLDTYHSRAPMLNASMLGVTGLDINGQPKLEATFEYEVCFKCHGVPGRSSCEDSRCSTALNRQMTRQDNEYNLREKIDPANPSLASYHPIHQNNPANNEEVPSLRLDIPLYRQNSLIYCGDCHNSAFSPAAGGNDASGPHGSRHESILALRYQLDAGPGSNINANTLCSKCHSNSVLLSDLSFPHRLHVQDNGLGCVNCHDPHGSLDYPHLINFLTSGTSYGNTLEITGINGFSRAFWIDAGRYSGSCWLNCHGTVHEGSSYGIVEEEPEPQF
jgi:predicted CXXCH cytochrome family protein